MFSLRLALEPTPSQTLGVLNLYSTTRDAFNERDQLLAMLLCAVGGIVVDGSHQQAHFHAATETRQVIGEAIVFCGRRETSPATRRSRSWPTGRSG